MGLGWLSVGSGGAGPRAGGLGDLQQTLGCSGPGSARAHQRKGAGHRRRDAPSQPGYGPPCPNRLPPHLRAQDHRSPRGGRQPGQDPLRCPARRLSWGLSSGLCRRVCRAVRPAARCRARSGSCCGAARGAASGRPWASRTLPSGGPRVRLRSRSSSHGAREFTRSQRYGARAAHGSPAAGSWPELPGSSCRGRAGRQGRQATGHGVVDGIRTGQESLTGLS